MNNKELETYLKSNKLDELLNNISLNPANEKERYLKLLSDVTSKYGDGDYHLISSPGRSEIGGNHTDHQHGHIVAAALKLDNVVLCKANNTNIINYYDPKFGETIVELNDLSIREEEKNTSASLIRGIAYRLQELGYKIGGFDAICDSKVLNGSGISSSACFEVLVVEIFNALFNDEKINGVDRALISQYSENVYFGKPSGLMDQLAISVGGFICVDFKDPNKPVIENYDFDLSKYGYDLLIVNAKGDHADLSDEYAAVPYEIKEVARELNVDVLADSSYDELLNNFKDIRNKIKNDRALLRSLHFYNEDKRAILEKEAIKNKDIDKLLSLMVKSGQSSFMYLQNVYPASQPQNECLAIALALTDDFLNGKGAYRVHGGGFAGTIQVVMPKDLTNDYITYISKFFGDDAVLKVGIRPFGTKTII